MDKRIIRRSLNIKEQVKQLRDFVAQKAPLSHKFIDALVSKYKNNDTVAADVLATIEKHAGDMLTMLTKNFNTDTEYDKKVLAKLHYDAPVYSLNNDELVRTGWTRTIGGRVAEYCAENNGELITHIDLTDMIKEDKTCQRLILGFNTNKVKTGFMSNGNWCSLKQSTIIKNIINSSRGNIGKMLAVATIIDRMQQNGYVPLSLKTGHWSPFYEGNYMKFSAEDGDVPADRIVLPFVRVEDWDTLNARTSNFFGSIEEHCKFLFSNAEKHSKYLYSDYYEIKMESRVVVLNVKDIKDIKLRKLFAKMDGHCVAYYRNAAILDANRQIIAAYRNSENPDVVSLKEHLLGRHNFAMQIRGSVKSVIEGNAPKAAHTPKGVMSLWKRNEWDNIVNAITMSNPELAGKITDDTIFMTDDVGKKIPGGIFIMNIRINSFEADKNDVVANLGYLGNTRTMSTQMFFEGIRAFIANDKITLDELVTFMENTDNMNWIVKSAIRGYKNLMDRLLKKSDLVITPEEAYNNMNELLNDIASNKVVEDIAEDSNDARFLGFNEMLVVLNDVALTLSMVGRRDDIENFDTFYSNMLETAIRSAFRVKLTDTKCGFVRRGYLIPAEICEVATNGAFVLKAGTFAVGKNLAGKCEYVVAYRQPIIWQYGMAPFKQTNIPLKTDKYDISYIGGIMLGFGDLSASGFQADFDGDTIYLINAFSFFRHDKNDHIDFKTMKMFYDMFWSKIIDKATGHHEYITDGIGIDNELCFNLVDHIKTSDFDPQKTPMFTNIIASKIVGTDKYTGLTFEESITTLADEILEIDINDTTRTLTSTMYRESLGQAIGLGDTKFSIATSIITNSLAKSMVEVALFDTGEDKFAELDMIAARMAAYLQSMIGAIKHTDKPLISVDKASNALIKDAAGIVGVSADIGKLGDILGRIRKGRLNKFTSYEVTKENGYSYKIVDMSESFSKGEFSYINTFSHLDRMVLETAFKFNGFKLSLNQTYETVVAADKNALTGAIGGVLVQKLLGGSSFDEYNKILYPESYMHISASNKDAVYNVPHRMSLAHAIVNYVGTVSRVDDDDAKIGTASVIKILRNRIIETVNYFADMQKLNNETYDAFIAKIGDVNLYDASADYYQKTGVGNKAPSFDNLIKKFGIVVDPDFAKKFDAINAKVSNGNDLTEEENALWLEMQLRLNDALPSNISTFNGVFGALINKKSKMGMPMFRDEVYMYSSNDKFEDVVSQMSTAKSGPNAWNHRKMLFGINSKYFIFELMSTLFVMAATSGNKSLFMLLGTRLTKFFIDLYGVEFVGANRVNDKVVPAQIIEYVTDASVVVKLTEAILGTDGKTKYVYEISAIDDNKLPNVSILTDNFADVKVIDGKYLVTCWYKHISGFIKKLADLGIDARI